MHKLRAVGAKSKLGNAKKAAGCSMGERRDELCRSIRVPKNETSLHRVMSWSQS